MALVGAVDIGGTKIAAALVDAEGVVLSQASVPTPAADGAGAVVAAAVRILRDLGNAAGDLAAVGVGAAGVIDPDTGVVVGATDALPGWTGTALKREFEHAFGTPVAVDNDCHAHALGEHWRGAASGCRSVLLAAVGTGVGGSWLLDGAVHHGASFAAGHIGHVPVPGAAGRECTCGGMSHVEAVAAGPAMTAAYRTRIGATAEQIPGLAAVAARADAADPVAREVIEAGAIALGQGLGGLTNVLDPDVVLVGGGVTGCGPVWWKALEEAWAAELLPAVRGRVELRAAALGADAALVGAARLGWGMVR
jgi:glucokinase